ncbi:GNAT family protein [Actimicrobium sp. CCC2.4]|uniref:GNAT family N-acetyltransferase n=1 Tax=Actimicrobium sp. CCC2.4 TaxID=3048606 RepID=UPI002AC93BA4|nr:GNAT family protein [Actimicrobium sp. CCC2.4]MEB0136168.1 GNAT family protein [Actimicrobium sp. CCC2.4]WPX33517.1 GNAT family protein [Actimicrobium sp. CCC2.4]
MIPIAPVTLELHGVRLEPMASEHAPALAAAAADGELWTLRVTSAPAPGDEAAYIATALNDRTRLPFVVRDIASNEVIGTTSFHDIVPALGRVEIGHTWYARTWQRTHVNTTCKWLLLRHAFEVLGCGVVGFRADNFNLVSQDAIARLGAKRDGVIRHHALRRDGTVRDTVMFSIVAGEWPEINAHLTYKLAQRGKRC